MNINIVLYFSFLFFISELLLMIAKRSKKKATKTRKDKKSLLIIWITILISISAGFFAAKYQDWNALNRMLAIVGLGVLIIGLLIRWISIIQLKKEFTVDVAISENHNLVTVGMYKYIRHPSYSGLILACFGLSLAMNSILSVLVVTIPILTAILYRIKVEERILMDEFGQIYKNYIKKTKKIIPFVY
jgi:protein-S-isoprenylcysteine O-methyltransferase Ste14